MTTGYPFWQPKKPKEPTPDVSQYWRRKTPQMYPPSKKLFEYEFIPTQVGGAPWFPPKSPVEVAEAEQQRKLAEFRGLTEEPRIRANLMSQIDWYISEYNIPSHRIPITMDSSIEELESFLELITRGRGGQVGGQARGEAQLPSNVQSVIQQAQSLGMDTSKFEQSYRSAPTEMARGYELWGFNAEVNRQFQSQQVEESRVMARQFPEQFAEFERERAITQQYPTGAPSEEIFGAWMSGKPEFEREWKVKQYQESPQLYPWYQEAGGRGMGKTFQEWLPTEPLATAYLGEKRATEAMRRPPQIRKQWQPARQR